ncbi:hypothetical protein EVAR_41465_1 [Eumeta japonica]|uniref:Uncharacterized protein n=1 Tax=Eumeta variegata TaxID=151549 RepID=A0A4C1X390_EUMVA|nr:hypothetical protein EVAR_41465_1 [Eumeta japonica]
MSVESIALKRLNLVQVRALRIIIVLAWVPSHSGVAGNVHVNLVAKDCEDKFSYINYPHDLMALSKKCLISSWTHHWSISKKSKGVNNFHIQPSFSLKPCFLKFKFDKRATLIISRMRLDHCSILMHLAKLRIRDSSVCECRLDDEDLNHIFISCP